MYSALATARAARGQWAESRRRRVLAESSGVVGAWPYLAVARAASGEAGTVRAEIEARPGLAFWRAEPSSTILAAIAPRIDLGRALALPAIAGIPAESRATAARGGFAFVPGPGSSVARLRAEASLLLGSAGDARDLFEAAVAECRAAGARAELARALLGLARVPWLGSPAAQSALAEGAALARELGMAPLLAEAADLARASGMALPAPAGTASFYPGGLSETAFEVLLELAAGRDPAAIAANLLLAPRTVGASLAALERLGIASPAAAAAFATEHGLGEAAPPPRRPGAARDLVFLFADIVDSTPVIRSIGDDALAALLLRHDEILQTEVAAAGGTYVKHLGDGAFASFPNAAAALAAARAVQARFPLRPRAAANSTFGWAFTPAPPSPSKVTSSASRSPSHRGSVAAPRLARCSSPRLCARAPPVGSPSRIAAASPSRGSMSASASSPSRRCPRRSRRLCDRSHTLLGKQKK